MMQDPDVLSGVVSTGQRVSGTVHILSSSRFDTYECPIDPESGWYSITIKKPDGPYLLWANLDGNKTYFSYSKGDRPSSIESTEDTDSNHSGGVYTHTANINPMTDLILAMAYLAEPQTLFDGTLNKRLPDTSRLRQKTGDIADILGPTLDYLDDSVNSSPDDDSFNFFHDDFHVDSNLDILLNILSIEFTDTSEERSVRLTIKDAYMPEGSEDSEDLVFFTFDLDEDDFAGDPKDHGFPDTILDRLKTIDGFPVDD